MTTLGLLGELLHICKKTLTNSQKTNQIFSKNTNQTMGCNRHFNPCFVSTTLWNQIRGLLSYLVFPVSICVNIWIGFLFSSVTVKVETEEINSSFIALR